MVASELRAKENRRREKESDPDTIEKKPKKTDFSDVYEGEWFVDAEEDEELADTLLKKHGFGTASSLASLLAYFILNLLPKELLKEISY